MNKLKQNFVRLELHQYAPELNVALLKGGFRDSTRAINVADYFNGFKPASRFVRSVRIQVLHEHNTSCNRQYFGLIDSYADTKTFIDNLKTRHNLPDVSFKVSTFTKYI